MSLLNIQVILLGDSGVGKTCILTRFRDGHFLGGNYISTVGIDFRVIFIFNLSREYHLVKYTFIPKKLHVFSF